MENKQIIECKQCQEKHERHYVGHFPSGTARKYVDERGLLWNGHLCGKCQKARSKVNMNALYHRRKAEPKND